MEYPTPRKDTMDDELLDYDTSSEPRYPKRDPKAASLALLAGSLLYAGCVMAPRTSASQFFGVWIALGILGVGMILLIRASV